MTEKQIGETQKIFELYDIMESRLQELGISFDEFTILYKSFRNPPKVEGDTNPFAWTQSEEPGWS
jgi:hypothetical protein